jgi:hypothetical protein
MYSVDTYIGIGRLLDVDEWSVLGNLSSDGGQLTKEMLMIITWQLAAHRDCRWLEKGIRRNRKT